MSRTSVSWWLLVGGTLTIAMLLPVVPCPVLLVVLTAVVVGGVGVERAGWVVVVWWVRCWVLRERVVPGLFLGVVRFFSRPAGFIPSHVLWWVGRGAGCGFVV